jgi:hypothetical protein
MYIYIYKIFSFVMSKIIEFNKFIIFSHLYIYLSSLTISFYFKTFFFFFFYVMSLTFYSILFKKGKKNYFNEWNNKRSTNIHGRGLTIKTPKWRNCEYHHSFPTHFLCPYKIEMMPKIM